MSGDPGGRRKGLEKVEAHYESSLDEHGPAPEGVGWNDPETHEMRFRKLAGVIRPGERGEGLSVNDLGCGYGAMARWFDREGIAVDRYVGYDISEKMLDEARRQSERPDRDEWIRASELETEADFTFASGIFNVRFEEDEEDWRRFVEETVLDMAEHSRRGFAFNALTTWVDWREDHLFYADPLHFFRFCKDEVSRFVNLVHDYPLYEWTLQVRTDG